MINVVNLEKSFGDNHVLKGINYEIHKNEKIVIIGPSGSGKSTFCAASTCLKPPQRAKFGLRESL